jgi:hypothetical protein
MNIMTLSDLMYRLITGHALAASHIVWNMMQIHPRTWWKVSCRLINGHLYQGRARSMERESRKTHRAICYFCIRKVAYTASVIPSPTWWVAYQV